MLRRQASGQQFSVYAYRSLIFSIKKRENGVCGVGLSSLLIDFRVVGPAEKVVHGAVEIVGDAGEIE